MKQKLCVWMASSVLLAPALFFSPAAFAKAGEIFSRQGTSSYGTAGCGLGSMVLGDKPGLVQVLASTINNILSPQTFAISTGTSGCGKSGQSSAAIFIETNKVALQKDAARGEGDTLTGLAEILGCSDQGAFARTLQQAYPQIFAPTNSADAMASSIESAVHTDAKLMATCKPQV